ncbi:MAG: PAS domain-containing sensor histidine kinase [Methylovirgula sp.]
MSFAVILEKQIASLVHPTVQTCQAERSRHEAFILRRLASSVAVICLAPLFLAIYGAPAVWHALVFVWCALPICSIVLLSRSGDLLLAQAICIMSFIGAAATIAAGGGPWEAALVWLVLAPFEGVLSQDFRLVFGGGALAALAAAVLALADQMNWMKTGFGSGHVALLILPAIFYATLLAYSIVAFQRKREHSAELRAEHYRAVYDAVGDLVVHHDRNGVAEFISPNCMELFGLSGAQLMGRGLFERVHVADRPALLKAAADAASSPETVCTTLRLRCASLPGASARGEAAFRWVEMRSRRFHMDAGDGLQGWGNRVVSILRDISQSKQREEDIETARAAAAEVNVWKDQFLANVSHELRTPLNAIIGFAEMLANTQLVPRDPEKRREYASIIQQSGQHLLSVVNSILDMSKIQSGAFDIRPEPFEIAPLIDLCCDMVKLNAKEGGVELVRAYPEKLDDVVGDKRACKQIFINLLSNAVKFTPRGGCVSIDVHIEDKDIVIAVADTGIGIAAHDLAKLGNPFFQAGASYDRPYEGTGLGLSVVRGLIGLHGGAISVESEIGKGTCVSVRLPLDCHRSGSSKNRPAKIETAARRSSHEDPRQFGTEMMVKKIA